ncbi:3-oxo-tetronate 4-phosphate decarboxylase [Salinibacterium sp. ZJ450]|uniref:3-oxo-tetronate 4-phosphate decarboxylase n=1 Tax=Salinibacterium sp. ZJ450 TaxID=2708338 RepID=UPI00142187F4|nr:3-oxo-tetronate 4-phosphate decarboxylase [Salinibacterium sp. ZJ450]
MTAEARARADIVSAAHSLFSRGLAHGRTGNVSVRVGEQIYVTPTGSSLGTVQAADLSVIDRSGAHVSGRKPSKESFLHAAILRARPQDTAVVHTHSTYSTAVSCLAGLDPTNAIPPLTAYFAMRVGRAALLPYHAPGDAALGPLAEHTAASHSAMLLSNHGAIVSGLTLDAAMDAIEELEATARLQLLLDGRAARPLTVEQAAALAPPQA